MPNPIFNCVILGNIFVVVLTSVVSFTPTTLSKQSQAFSQACLIKGKPNHIVKLILILRYLSNFSRNWNLNKAFCTVKQSDEDLKELFMFEIAPSPRQSLLRKEYAKTLSSHFMLQHSSQSKAKQTFLLLWVQVLSLPTLWIILMNKQN